MGVEALSHMEAEAREQGEILAGRTEPGWASADAAASILNRDDVDYLVIAARGSSDNAARYAQYLLGSRARLSVALAAPWLYSAETPPRLERAAVMAISQSGESPDIVAVMGAARAQDRPTIAITNVADSPVAREAEVVVGLLAGDERSVAATKTFLASLHAVAQIAARLDPRPEDATWFERLPALVSAVVDEQLRERHRFDPMAEAALLTVLGRGLQLPAAYETALKVRELSGLAAEAFSPPDLMHGPVAALRESGAVWLVSTTGRDQPDLGLFAQLGARAGVTVAVSDRDELVAAADIGVSIPPGLPDWAAAIVSVVPGQAAALRLGERRGVDVDRPLGLSKVTLTR